MSKIGVFLLDKRKVIMGCASSIGLAMMRFYRFMPLGLPLRNLIKEAIFTTSEKIIFNTAVYQHWRGTRLGGLRLDMMLRGETFAKSYTPAIPVSAPSAAAWAALPARNNAGALVDVIIPVYKGFDETLNSIYAALAYPQQTAHEVIVINDASPDAALTAALRDLAAAGHFTFLENEQNLGFVATVNRGMQLHPERDVLLLNADTEVYNNWLDRLYSAARNNPKTASVTPFSNNAEICSYPFFCKNNYMQLECSFQELDSMAAKVNAGAFCEVPTGVGFCMYITRESLNALGLFDVEAFGKGYGEENDFCMRAFTAGWKNLMAMDCFVRHIGGASFLDEKEPRIAEGLRVLNRRYPQYSGMVSAFFNSDPPAPYRRALDCARLLRMQQKSENILIISHALGGGTERHILDMASRLNEEGVGCIALRPDTIEPHLINILAPGAIRLFPNLVFDIHKQVDEIITILKHLTIKHVHVHHTIGFDQAIHDFIPYACQEIGIEYDITVHDYFFVCPRINLINAQEVYCGEPAISSCEKCVTQNKSYIGNLSVWQWRFRYERLLAGARKVFTPSNDVSTRMKRYYPAVTFTTMPHIEAQAAPAQPIAAPSGETVKVAIIGALGVHKGSNIILACAKDAKRRKLPIEYVIFGDSDLHDGLKAQKNVYLHGQYKEGEIFSLLAAKPCHFAFFPSVWPETYCYTLSIAFQAKLYPVTFDLGAPADRIRAAGWGSVLPITLMDDAEKLNDALMSVVVTPAPDTQILPAGNELYPSITKDYYALPELSSGQ